MREKIYIVKFIKGNPNMGNEYGETKNSSFLFESTAIKLGLKDIKIGDKIKLIIDNNGFYVKGEKV